jgi:thiamine pyrophosphate-dependent acetolactate synthase large subunit-like protein
VKHNFLVRDLRELAAAIKKAFYILAPAGPVLKMELA